MSDVYRAPSVEEAVAWLLKNAQPWARAYRRECLRYWRELAGDTFAVRVEKEMRKRWGRRRDKA